MAEEVNNIVVFPGSALHRLDTGGVGSVEIKHIHPEHATEAERQEQLASVHHTCAALVRLQREKEARRKKKGA